MDYNNTKNQEIKGQFVNREVKHCVSSLIHELAQDEKYFDELAPVLMQDDWEEPAEDLINYNMNREDCIEYLESLAIDCKEDEPIETLREAVLENAKEEGLQEFCEQKGIDTYTNEALEHWIVSDWLAAKLQDHGEMVLRDADWHFPVWGRQCSGQAILLDDVISKICEDMEILEGQKYDTTGQKR